MKNNNQELVGAKVRVSRRSVLKTASAAVAGLALGNPTPAAASVPPPGSLDYGAVGLWPENVYPLLAAWLVLTTSETVVGQDIASLAQSIGLSNGSAKALIDKFNGPKKQSFTDVRRVFQAIANQFAPVTSPYSGGICPDVVKPLQDIAALYQPHPTTPH